MAAQLVTLAEAKAHLNLDHDSSDAQVALYLQAAEERVIRHLKLDAIPAGWLAAGSPPVSAAPFHVKAAILIALGVLFAEREGNADPINAAVISLLQTDRDPTLA